LKLVQTPLQVSGVLPPQAHRPFWQVWPPVQALPQDPQLALSVWGFTQLPPQQLPAQEAPPQVQAQVVGSGDWPGGQPFWQVHWQPLAGSGARPVGQETPAQSHWHPFAGSGLWPAGQGPAHWPWQQVWPVPQAEAHCRFWQVWQGPQATPHAPQLLGLAVTSMQVVGSLGQAC
jgi:hypothetical protein